jgi:hypothetical protein
MPLPFTTSATYVYLLRTSLLKNVVEKLTAAVEGSDRVSQKGHITSSTMLIETF